MQKEKIHFAHSYFHAPVHRITINLIGCGGTGSFILSKLARLDYALSQLDMPGIHVNVYDNDIVQQHNVGRQNFTPYDVGKNKAICLVEKINFAYGIQWQAIASYIGTSKDISDSNIFITAVDNIQTRQLFGTYFHGNRYSYSNLDYKVPYYWIDAGNGKDFGQVVLSTIQKIKQPKSKKYQTVDSLQNVIEKYGDLSKFDNEKDQGIKSCSMEQSLAKQDLFINDIVSVYVVDIVWKLIKELKIDYSGVIINQAGFATRPLTL